MNDEIKEILEEIDNKIIPNERWNKIKDYITNLQNQLNQASLDIQELTEKDLWCPTNCDKLIKLQKENERLKKEKKKLSNDLAEAILFNQKRCEQNKELKQRIDKAIEYIDDKVLSNGEVIDQLRIIEVEKLLNILNGGDEE